MITVLVTGVSAGFGQEIARRLVREGMRVIGVARREARLQALTAELGTSFLPCALDMRDTTAVRNFADTLPEAWRDIDILINNAGLALGIAKAQESHWADWAQMIDTNISGLTALTHAVLPGMVRRHRGHIVMIGSIAGRYPYQGGHVYGATKAYVAQFAANLRTDLLGLPIRVTNIAPGLSGGSEFSAVRMADPQAAETVYAGTTPLTPIDIAEIIAWVVQQPTHVNINEIEVMPVCQAAGGLAIDRSMKDVD